MTHLGLPLAPETSPQPSALRCPGGFEIHLGVSELRRRKARLLSEVSYSNALERLHRSRVHGI